MANIKTCKKCGKVYSGETASEYCSACVPVPAEPLDLIKAYLSDNPEAGLEEISKVAQLDIQALLKFYKDGKLKLERDLSPILVCERCEVLIRSGRFCDACAQETSQALKRAFNEEKQHTDKSDEMKGVYHIGVKRK